MLYGKITKPCDRCILHLIDLRTLGEETVSLATPATVLAFIQKHRQVQAVMVYDSRAPRRAVPVQEISEEWLEKFFRPSESHALRS